MKVLFLGVIVLLSFSACAKHKKANFYDRANNASEKSLNSLERDTSR